MKALESHLSQMNLPKDGKSFPGKEIFSFFDKGCIVRCALRDALNVHSVLCGERNKILSACLEPFCASL